MHALRNVALAALTLTAMGCAVDADGIPADAVRVELDHEALMDELDAAMDANPGSIDADTYEVLQSTSEVWTVDDLELGSPEPQNIYSWVVAACYGAEFSNWTVYNSCVDGGPVCTAMSSDGYGGSIVCMVD